MTAGPGQRLTTLPKTGRGEDLTAPLTRPRNLVHRVIGQAFVDLSPHSQSLRRVVVFGRNELVADESKMLTVGSPVRHIVGPASAHNVRHF